MTQLHELGAPILHLQLGTPTDVLDQGSHEPLLCALETESGTAAGEWVVKSPSMYAHGSTSLLREFVGADLATLLRIPTPRVALLRLPCDAPATDTTPAGRRAATIYAKDAGKLAFCSELLHAPPLDPAVLSKRGRRPAELVRGAIRVFAFDALFWHYDRTRRNPNLLLHGQTIVAIDHDRVCHGIEQLDDAGLPLYDECQLGHVEALQDHVLVPIVRRQRITPSGRRCKEIYASWTERTSTSCSTVGRTSSIGLGRELGWTSRPISGDSFGSASRWPIGSWRRPAMSPRDVEFRLLQLVVSAVADERVTLALLHWDGTSLRFAANAARIPSDLGPGAVAVRATLRGLRNIVTDLTAGDQTLLGLGIDRLLEIREGRGGLLSWSPVRRGRTASPQGHFEQLARQLDLRVGTGRPGRPVGDRPSVGSELTTFGERLRDTLASPDRIGVRRTVVGLREYVSPLSWRNHIWHHSFPLVLHRPDPDVVLSRVEATLGRIDVCVPANEGGVIVAVHPPDADVAARLDEVARFVQAGHEGRVRVVRAPLAKARKPALDALEEQIRADVLASQ